ncbi:hypothetical protein TrRE_jg5424 [Triparma retinervis]|uniref:Uncharacterized protein n=1 Tax=Triparma retinervis TaxID=2557542 RepID=A0A9W6ZPY7_9STRA|nr:hypothetical protein TrRE_jg5424 [Triparma retinervis]
MLSSVEVLRGSLLGGLNGGLHDYGGEEGVEEEQEGVEEDYFIEEVVNANATDVELRLIREARNLASSNSVGDLKREIAWAEHAIVDRLAYLSATGGG